MMTNLLIVLCASTYLCARTAKPPAIMIEHGFAFKTIGLVLIEINHKLLCLTYENCGDMMCLLIKKAMTEKACVSNLSESPTFGVSRAGKAATATAPEQVSEQIISRRIRLTPDTALLSESSGWNRVI